MTTGHEWNGIKELNTPVPRPVYFFLAMTFLFSVIYWLLMPAWPTGVAYTKGLLGLDQRVIVADSLQQAAVDRARWVASIEAGNYTALQADENVMRIVRQTGNRLFGDNCAVCHGIDARGDERFPNLTDNSWLWGGDPETVAETLRVGINSTHPETRVSQMPAFGKEQMISRDDIEIVVTHVMSLSDPSIAAGEGAAKVTAGKEVFAANCAACHGETGHGNVEMGAPDLTDADWIYGSDRQAITAIVFGGRQGHMPSWERRLPPADRKILTLYVLDLGGHTP